MKTIKDCEFLFIAGVEGSGTTITLKLLETLPNHVCLGGKYITDGFSKPGKKLNKLSRKFWHFPRYSDKRRNKWLQKASVIEVPDTVKTVIYKRSYPFVGPNFIPDIHRCFSILSSASTQRPHRSVRSILPENFDPKILLLFHQLTCVCRYHPKKQPQ